MNQNQAEAETQIEIIPIGMPGFGLSPFLYEDTMREMPANLKANEIIIFYHLGDDFQSPIEGENSIRYTVKDIATVEVNPEDARLRHDLTHYYLRGFISFQLVGTVRSNYLTPKVVHSLLAGSNVEAVPASGDGLVEFPRRVGYVTDYYTITEPGHAGIKSTDLKTNPQGNNFVFRMGSNADSKEAFTIADSMLGTAQEIAQANGVKLRVVTIPQFPDDFYNTFQTGKWESQLGDYDLLLPERELAKITQKYNIPMLAMGQYMLEDGLSTEDIHALYLPNEFGSFTAKGNQYFAEAIYSCFYSNQANIHCTK